MADGTILLVDDDDLFRESLGSNLADAGFNVVEAENGERAIAHFEQGQKVDLVILDWRMPGLSGVEVLKRLRSNGNETPVIFLTSLNDQIYEEAALQGGAIDFVEKSRSFLILMKRIELVLAGVKSQGAQAASGQRAISRGTLELRTDSCRAYWKGQQLDLTLAEFNMIHCLVARAGEDVRYRDLYDLLHGEGFAAGQGAEGYRANVRAFIKRIRQKFQKVDSSFDHIKNYPGFGYRWVDSAVADG